MKLVLAVAIGLASDTKCRLVNAEPLAEKTPVTPLSSAADQEPNESVCLSFGLDANPEGRSVCGQFVHAAKTGQWEAAAQGVQKLKALYPQNGIGDFCQGYAELKQGRYVAAVRLFQAAVDRRPGVVVAHLDLGIAFFALRQYKLFEEEMLWVIANKPSEALPHYYLGLSYSANPDQLEQAANCFEQAVNRNPSDFQSHYQLGKLLQAKGNLPGARARFETAEAKASSQGVAFGEALKGLAEISLRLGDLAAGVRQAQLAVKRDPKSASARLLLGKLLVQHNESKSGIQELKTAALLNPTHAATHYWLSRAYQQMKLSDAAKLELELFTRIKATYGDDE
jgi:tetratricopeptide (TPR) repeat protein